MTYNVIDDLSKLRITFPFMEVVKIPQQRENLLKILMTQTQEWKLVINSTTKKNFIGQVKR
jgi:hypothetical protein